MVLSKDLWKSSFKTMIPLSRATTWMAMHSLLWGEPLAMMLSAEKFYFMESKIDLDNFPFAL